MKNLSEKHAFTRLIVERDAASLSRGKYSANCSHMTQSWSSVMPEGASGQDFYFRGQGRPASSQPAALPDFSERFEKVVPSVPSVSSCEKSSSIIALPLR